MRCFFNHILRCLTLQSQCRLLLCSVRKILLVRISASGGYQTLKKKEGNVISYLPFSHRVFRTKRQQGGNNMGVDKRATIQ